MPHPLSLRQIEGFLLASELRSFSRAAEAMHISQSAFSQLIRELENALGIRLFDRTTRRISMTSAGEAMYRKMSAAIEAIDEACEEARAIARVEQGHLTLGTLSSFGAGLVTRALGRMRERFPAISVTLREGGNGEMLSRVSKGEVDMAVCALTDSAHGLSFTPLFDDELAVVVQRSSRHAGVALLDWKMLADESLVRAIRSSSTDEHISASLAAHNVALKTQYEQASLPTALSMIRAGFGIGFMSRIVEDDLNTEGLVCVRIKDPPVRRVGIYRKADRAISPAVERFEEFLRTEIGAAQRRLSD